MTPLRFAVLIAGLAIFAAIVWAVRFHFQATSRSPRFLALSAASAINAFVFGRELWLRSKPETQLLVALALMLIAGGLFASALIASRKARLKLIYDPDAPQQILQDGPYRFIRHPFYTSYIVYWTACAVATANPINIAYAIAVTVVLALAARSEEQCFAGSPIAPAYERYREQAGMLWPKFPGVPRSGT